MLIARYLRTNLRATQKKEEIEETECDRSIEVHGTHGNNQAGIILAARGTIRMGCATRICEGWFTTVFPRCLDLPLAKPTTAQSKPIRTDRRARVDGSVVIAIFKLSNRSLPFYCFILLTNVVPFVGLIRLFSFFSFLPSILRILIPFFF